MVDTYYNSLIENLLLKLKKMVPYYEDETMDEYKTMGLKDWDKIKDVVDSIYNYEPVEKKLTIMNYFNDKVYPVIKSGRTIKQGFHKIYAVRVDDYQFRNMLSELETLMTYQK